jgi:hypothetical protein
VSNRQMIVAIMSIRRLKVLFTEVHAHSAVDSGALSLGHREILSPYPRHRLAIDLFPNTLAITTF